MARRPVLTRIALVLAGLLAGCVLVEILARLVRPDAAADLLFDAPGNTPPGMYVADTELGYTPNPGFRGTVRSLGYSVPLRFNALGLRGPEADSRTGWVVVGDSFALSAQVPEEETFVGRLGERGTFWNAGVDGYSTWHARIRYQRVATALEPVGVVLLYFLGNDLADDERFANGIRMPPNARPNEPLAMPPGNPVLSFLAKRSFLYGQVRVWQRRQAFAAGRTPEAGRWRSELRSFTTEGRKDLPALIGRGSGRALQALRDEVSRRGDRLLVAVAPPAFVVDEGRRAATFSLVGIDPATADVDAPGQAILAELQRLGIEGCDLTAPLRAATTAPLYFTYDGHWTAAGHAVVADAIAGCLG